MVIREELLHRHPHLARDVFDAFVEAKRIYLDQLRSGKIEKLTPVDELHQRVMQVTGGDPLPYGIDPNRKMLEEVIASAVSQKVLTRPVTLEELFPAATHSLVG
jgi:4,5-dihydroxyphthalate decarboxylase